MILHFKLIEITPERIQITPEVRQIMHLGHIFFTGPCQTYFLHWPPPLLKINITEINHLPGVDAS